MPTIANEVAAFEADMELHLDRLNADARWGGGDLTLADVDAAGAGDGRDYANLSLLNHLIGWDNEFDGVLPVDGTNLYMALVKPHGSRRKEYYATTSGRALVRALLDAWRLTDAQVARADKMRAKRKAADAALASLADVHRELVELRDALVRVDDGRVDAACDKLDELIARITEGGS